MKLLTLQKQRIFEILSRNVPSNTCHNMWQ